MTTGNKKIRDSGGACVADGMLGEEKRLFFGSDHGGERGTLLYMPPQRVDPKAYLRHILSVLPEWPINKVAELLPWNVVLPA
ncbi:hypothetical protein GCM10023078_16740 [Gibbsiella greigii]